MLLWQEFRSARSTFANCRIAMESFIFRSFLAGSVEINLLLYFDALARLGMPRRLNCKRSTGA